MTAMRRRFRAVLMQLYRPFALRTIARDRTSRFCGLRLTVPKGVFHPGLFFSTKVLARSVVDLGVKGRRVVDVGCGTGALSLVAAREGAAVTAIDVNPLAVETTRANAVRNSLSVEAIESDLFDALGDRRFDVVVVNPPFYRRDPTTVAEQAWLAGGDLGYFERFFTGLGAHVEEGGDVLMVLSEDCDLTAIRAAAERHGWRLDLRRRKIVWLEEVSVYSVRR
jgi:release factor glutamine methyltransferase